MKMVNGFNNLITDYERCKAVAYSHPLYIYNYLWIRTLFAVTVHEFTVLFESELLIGLKKFKG